MNTDRLGYVPWPLGSGYDDPTVGLANVAVMIPTGTVATFTVDSTALFKPNVQQNVQMGNRDATTGHYLNREVFRVKVLNSTTFTVITRSDPTRAHSTSETMQPIWTNDDTFNNPGPLTTTGSMPYLAASGAMGELLAPGSDGNYALAFAGGVPTSWQSAPTWVTLASPPPGTAWGSSGAPFDIGAVTALQLGGGTLPSFGGDTFPSWAAVPLLVLSQNDYAQSLVASTSDGFAGAEYDWGFVATSGDVNPVDGTPAIVGHVYALGAFWAQMEDTTNANSLDAGFIINSGTTGYVWMVNSVGDVGIGRVHAGFGVIPTNVSSANLFLDGSTGSGVFKGTATAADFILSGGGTLATQAYVWAQGFLTSVVSAPKWTTARNLAGNSVDGSANVAFANKFIVQGTADAGLSAAQFLGALGTGLLKSTTTTGVLSIATAGDIPDLSATYSAKAGNSSLVTVGTVTSGTWNATAIGAAYGGTGQTVYAVGDLLYASTTTALSKLADVATTSVLISGGVGIAPAWGKLSTSFFTSTNVSNWTNDANYTTLSAVAGVGYLTSVTAHNMLSATHGDTLTDTVVRGDILYGNSTPKWARLAKPGALSVLANNATDTAWATVTGTGSPVYSTSPILVTPTLGVALATSVNGNAFTTGTYTLTGAAGKTLTFNNSITLSGTDAQTYTFPTTSATIARTDAANTFATANDTGTLISAGSITGSGTTPLLSLTGTWNTSGVSQGLLINVTNTASAAASAMLDVRIGNASVMRLRRDGNYAIGSTVFQDGYIFGYSGMSAAVGASGTRTFGFNTATAQLIFNRTLSSPTGLGWETSDPSSTPDAVFTSPAAATFQAGVDVNGAAINQTFTGANGITGADRTGGNFTLNSGKGTGAGAVSSLHFGTPTVLTTGTTAQSITDRLILDSAGVKCQSPLWLNNAAVTGLTPAVLAAAINATLVIYDSTGQAYRVPCTI